MYQNAQRTVFSYVKEALSKQDMQEGYVLVRMHAVKNAASPHISLYLSLYEITLMKKNNNKNNNPDHQLEIRFGNV